MEDAEQGGAAPAEGAQGGSPSDREAPLLVDDRGRPEAERRADEDAGKDAGKHAGEHAGGTTAIADGSIWPRVRWATSTVAVAGSSFFLGIIALWTGSYITHHSLNQTALRWDGDWYYRISQEGYVSALPAPVKVLTPAAIHRPSLRPAFFPGLPLFERFLHAVVGGPAMATTFLAGGIGLVASCLLLRALVGRAFGEAAAWRATVVFAFFPGAYVFVMGYSEALEIPLAILVLYALRCRWYLVAGLATAAATTTRLTGVALVAACGVAAIRELVVAVEARRRAARVRASPLVTAFLSPVIGLTGLIGYMVYLHAKTGSYRAFQTAERIGWGNSFDLSKPYETVRHFAASPFTVPYRTEDLVGVVVVAACFVFLATDGLRRLRLEETTYATVILLAWMFAPAAGSWFRFVQAAFPVIALLVLRLGQRWYPAVASAGAFLLGILTVLFAAAVAFSP